MASSGYVEWKDLVNKRNNSKFDENLIKLTEGKHRLRLVGNIYVFYQHFEPFPVIVPNNQNDPIHQSTGNYPKKKYAVNAFYRDQDNKLMILRGGPTIFESVMDWAEDHGANPCGEEDGPDWTLRVKVPGGNKRQTKYSMSDLKKTPLTEEEKEFIESEGLFDLSKMFKPKTHEEIQQMLDEHNGKGDSDGSDDSNNDEDDDDDDDGNYNW